MSRILIISAHADDESFGMGGTLGKLASQKSNLLYWLIATKIWEPKWEIKIIKQRKKSIKAVKSILNFQEVIQWEYQDNRLDLISKDELQKRLINILNKFKPQIIFLPSPWDDNYEHKLMYEIVEMSTKPCYSSYVEKIIAYEIPSSTDASFKSIKKFPLNLYYDIENYMNTKIDLIKQYKSELLEFPHPRSIKYIQSLANVRGVEAGVLYAEGFHIFREIIK